METLLLVARGREFQRQQQSYENQYMCGRGEQTTILELHVQCESKNPPEDLWQFFQNRYKFFSQILHAYLR